MAAAPKPEAAALAVTPRDPSHYRRDPPAQLQLTPYDARGPFPALTPGQRLFFEVNGPHRRERWTAIQARRFVIFAWEITHDII